MPSPFWILSSQHHQGYRHRDLFGFACTIFPLSLALPAMFCCDVSYLNGLRRLFHISVSRVMLISMYSEIARSQPTWRIVHGRSVEAHVAAARSHFAPFPAGIPFITSRHTARAKLSTILRPQAVECLWAVVVHQVGHDRCPTPIERRSVSAITSLNVPAFGQGETT